MGVEGEYLFPAVAKLAADLGSLYTGNYAAKQCVLEFIEANGWTDVVQRTQSGRPVIADKDFEMIREPLTLWLSAYRKPGREKIQLMLRHFDGTYPVTCRLYRKFITSRRLEDAPTSWKLLDFLLSEIDREITAYGESDLEKLIKPLDTEATVMATRLFADFLRTAEHNGRPLTKWTYTFDPRENPERIVEAYSIQDFAAMARCIFNEELWVQQRLVEKAVQSREFADVWLYTALHFVCALRKTDMKRLPAPALPYDGKTTLKMIADGSFSKQEAVALIEELGIRLKLKPMRPSKTACHGKAPELKLFIPESLRAPLGVIMATALAHHPEIRPGDVLGSLEVFKHNRNLRNIRGFFGDDFADALGNRNFSSRRSNKSYLQGIDAVAGADSTPGKPKGYMLAALARSHKSGIGTLAKTTEIYLKDAKFRGYSPEFIIREMFERGVFSFIPAILLDMYADAEYKRLPVKAQTKLIGEIGLAAQQIEWMTGAMDQRLQKAGRLSTQCCGIRQTFAKTLPACYRTLLPAMLPADRKKHCA